jgi:hypothetical protein
MNDYSALAQRVSMSLIGVRGCLMLSRDGMVLGAHPEGDAESQVRSSWVRFAAVGDAERSYVEFPDQVWAFVRRGGYSAFAVADPGVRPGVLVDLLEQALMAGERDRASDREHLRLPEVPSAPSGKPRTSLHKQERVARAAPAPGPSEDPPAAVTDVTADEAAAGAEPRDARSDGSPDEARDPEAEHDPAAPSDAGPDLPRRAERPEDEGEVDRILLAKEFAGLLQVPKEDDEASG